MPNRLAQETSPYLLQHQNNPVDWYAWGDEAFAKAKRLDKPILLSVGYSACHWCHVMAHESFEDAAIAAQMNDAYINIKVDREERPDVDAIYMGAVQAMTGRGGWPMTVFLTPAGVPFYGGTYFPPEDRQGMPGLTRVLAAVADAYKNKRGEVEQAGQQLLGALSTTADLQPTDGALTVEVLDTAAAALISVHDDDFGGFGRAPKFPQAMVLEFLLRQHKRTGDHEPLRVAEISLQRMAGGGMYDQVGGGFHRYSTDSVWLVPHFEKMLYDNALLARLYLDAYKLTGNQDYQRITRETLDYVLREMTNVSGGFYSAQDADSEGEEGRFFLWTPAQLREVLPDDADVIGRYFGVSEAGNFEGRNILHADKPADEWARDEGIDPAKFASLLRYAKAQLYKARELRVHPGRDEKVLTAWNGMMLRAFAEAAYVLKDATYLRVAQNNANFLIREMRDTNGRLLRTWKDGRAHLMAYLEDYACMADGLLALYQATFDPHYFVEARRLADEMIHLFWDESLQGFFDTGSDHEALITRPRDLWDNATPSGSSVAADVLLRLALLTDTPLYEHCAVTSLSSIAPVIERAATGFGRALSVIDFHLSSSQELAVVWPDGSGAEAAGPMLDVVRGRYAPNLMLVGSPAGQVENVSVLLDDRQALRDRTTAYLCERYVCQAPTTDPEELREQMDAARI